MDETLRFAAFQAEYFHLQKTVEDFDGKALTIKAWSITFSMSVLVGSFTTHARPVLLIASASSILFWTLETIWKSFQLGYYNRIEAIERHFRLATDREVPLQINKAWMESWSHIPWSDVLRMAWWPHIALPHAVVAAGGITLYVLTTLDALKV